MHTRFDDDILVLVVEPGDQCRLPRLIEPSGYECELTFHTMANRNRFDIAGWLMTDLIAVRIFGSNCHISEAHLDPVFTRLRVYIPTGI